MGTCVVRARCVGAAPGRTRGGSRIANRVGRLWSIAWSVLTRGADETRESTRRDGRHDLRTRNRAVLVEMVACGLHLVGCNRDLHNIWRWLPDQPGFFDRRQTVDRSF